MSSWLIFVTTSKIVYLAVVAAAQAETGLHWVTDWEHQRAGIDQPWPILQNNETSQLGLKASINSMKFTKYR